MQSGHNKLFIFLASSLDKAQRNQGSLLKDKSLADPNNLPDPEVLYLL